MSEQSTDRRADQQVRLGIVGLGAQGGYYARFLAEGKVPSMRIGAICDIDESKREAAEGIGVPFFTDYAQMFASGEVDAVVTTIPHYLHPEVGIAALEAGLHVLGEKPAAVYTAQARTLMECADAHPELTFAIMFNQRTNPLYVDLKRLIDSGELGALRHSSWIITTWWRPQAYYEQSAWRATWGGEGGGVLVNQAPHQLDLWQWLCGVPRSCFAKCSFGFRRDIAVEDEVNALVDFGDGATGHFMTATHDLAGTDRLEMLFDGGKIVVDDSATVTVTRLARPEQQISGDMTVDQVRELFAGAFDPKSLATATTTTYTSVWGEQHCSVLENFARAVLHGEPLIAPGRDGLHGVRLANAMHLSAWTGREVDMVSFDEESYLRELNKRIAAEGTYPQREA